MVLNFMITEVLIQFKSNVSISWRVEQLNYGKQTCTAASPTVTMHVTWGLRLLNQYHHIGYITEHTYSYNACYVRTTTIKSISPYRIHYWAHASTNKTWLSTWVHRVCMKCSIVCTKNVENCFIWNIIANRTWIRARKVCNLYFEISKRVN